MANYKYYIAQSKEAVNNPDMLDIDFHLRIALEGSASDSPFLAFDSQLEHDNQVRIDRIVENDEIFYTVSVWLEELEMLPSGTVIYRDRIFTEPNPPDYDKIYGKIIIHKRLLNGGNETEETSKDLVYEPMPAEYPIDDN